MNNRIPLKSLLGAIRLTTNAQRIAMKVSTEYSICFYMNVQFFARYKKQINEVLFSMRKNYKSEKKYVCLEKKEATLLRQQSVFSKSRKNNISMKYWLIITTIQNKKLLLKKKQLLFGTPK